MFPSFRVILKIGENMKTGNTLIDNIGYLNTYINMTKSNEFLSIYLEKISNKKSQSIKFINTFDSISLDLLYTSLQIMNINICSKEEISKIDRHELKYYFDKVKGLNYFKNQVPEMKTPEIIINYLKDSLAKGNYICNPNNTIKFANGLLVDSDWLVDFSSFIVTSLNNNIHLSSDGSSYSIKTISLPENKKNFNYFKDLKIYEYVVTKKNKKKLTFSDVKFLKNNLNHIENYDFKKMQNLNSLLAKENFILSINKKPCTLNHNDRLTLQNLLNEKKDNDSLILEFIKKRTSCYNTRSELIKANLIDNYEMLRSLAHAYKNNYSLRECRKLYDFANAGELESSLAIANFYIMYIYDEDRLNKYFNYSLLDLENLKPTIIDYETPEYKSIIQRLSKLNKRMISENRKINKLLEQSRGIIKDDVKKLESNSPSLAYHCQVLEKVVAEVKNLREELLSIKDENHTLANQNKAKINYIKEAICNGDYSFDKDTTILSFTANDSKDYHQTFSLDITLQDFNTYLFSEGNQMDRINFYQL